MHADGNDTYWTMIDDEDFTQGIYIIFIAAIITVVHGYNAAALFVYCLQSL